MGLGSLNGQLTLYGIPRGGVIRRPKFYDFCERTIGSDDRVR